MQLIDSHCHIHDPEFASKYSVSVEVIVTEAQHSGIERYICVGTSVESSRLALEFAQNHSGAYASIALHPHEVGEKPATQVSNEFKELAGLVANKQTKMVAIGECGLDYYYHNEQSVRDEQVALFRKHIDLALEHNLPMIFHIRDAFDDFFAIIDEYSQNNKIIRGVVHSFTAHVAELEGCIKRGLYIGINGIMTFTKEELQLEAARSVPLDRLLFETDAPFLTPVPFRGRMCEIKHMVETVKFLSDLRSESVELLAEKSTKNAINLFGL